MQVSSSKNQSNTQNLFHTDGKNPYVMKSGLQGDELEAARTARKISVALDELATKLMKKGRSRDEVFEIIRTSTFIGPQASEALINLNRTYQPLNDSQSSFAHAYLISISPLVLHGFRHYLIPYFKDPTQGIGPNMWVTRRSIEVYVEVDEGHPMWWDLNLLSIDVLKNLEELVAKTGRPPQEQESAGAEFEQTSKIQDEQERNESYSVHYSTIKSLVFDFVHRCEGRVQYTKLAEEVLHHFPNSKWKKSHWHYWRYQILQGKTTESFSKRELENLQKRREVTNE